MKLALAVAATLSWMGCGVDMGPGAGGDDGTGEPVGPGEPDDPASMDPNDPGTGTGPVTEVSGHITASTTWSDSIHVIGATVIDAGVTVTVLPGTTVDVTTNQGYGLTVSGALDIQGSKAARVTFRGATAGQYWSDVTVRPGGVLTARYLVQTGGGLNISGTGRATIVDSHFSHVGGDLLIMSGGTLDMSYSAIGLDTGHDTTHCDLHVGGVPTVKVTHSNISAARFGIMFYGGNGADFTYNNWFGNGVDVATQGGPPVTGDFSYGHFAAGAPTHVGFTLDQLSDHLVDDAGVR